MNILTHRNILHYIDQKLCDLEYDYCKWQTVANYKFIQFSNESGYWAINKEDKGKFFNDGTMIVIHRSISYIPNISLLDEVCTTLHEYGHFLSLKNGNGKDITEVGLKYENGFNIHNKYISLKEERNAWKYGFYQISKLPIPLKYKIIIYLYLPYTMLCSLFSYFKGYFLNIK